MKEDTAQKKNFCLGYFTLLVGLFVILCFFMWHHVDGLLDSDMASEMLLGKILSEENAVLTQNWFYSTELRVLNTQLIFSFFFHFFQDWTTVRMVSSVVLYLVLLASYYYFLRQAGYSRRLFAVSGIFLILPFSKAYLEFVLLGLYYIPHICISFVTLGLIFQYAGTNKKKSKMAIVILMIILSVLAGMGGLRQIIILYLPLVVATSFWTFFYKRENRSFLINGIVCLVFSMIGYLINIRVFAGKYQFSKFTEDIQWKDFSIEGLESIFQGFLRFFGFSDGRALSFTTVSNGFAFLMLLVALVCLCNGIGKGQDNNVKQENRIVSLYLISSVLVFIGIYTFTNMSYTTRYVVPILIFAIPVIFINLEEADWKKKVKCLLFALLLTGGVLCSFVRYQEYARMSEWDRAKGLREITNYLEEKKIKNGYATFWQANVLTELSDGYIDVYSWLDGLGDGSGIKKLQNIDQIYEWLQLTSHIKEKPKGEVFLLFTQNEYELCPLKECLDTKETAYETEDFVLYIFDDYENLIRYTEDAWK